MSVIIANNISSMVDIKIIPAKVARLIINIPLMITQPI